MNDEIPSGDILIVDDEVGIRDLLSEILQDEGYSVALAENAEETSSHPPDESLRRVLARSRSHRPSLQNTPSGAEKPYTAHVACAILNHMKQGMGRWCIGRSQQRGRDEVKAAPEHSQMMTLVNSLTDAVLSTDAHGVITIYNAAMIGLLDTNATLHGHHINEIFQLQTLGRTPINVFEELSKSPSIRTRDDLIMPLSDGDHLRLEATFAPILGGSSSTAGVG